EHDLAAATEPNPLLAVVEIDLAQVELVHQLDQFAHGAHVERPVCRLLHVRHASPLSGNDLSIHTIENDDIFSGRGRFNGTWARTSGSVRRAGRPGGPPPRFGHKVANA